MDKLPRRHPFSQVDHRYFRRRHRKALGAAFWLLARALGVPPTEDGNIAFSLRWLARELEMDPSNVCRDFRERILGRYLIDTGKKVGTRTVYSVVDPDEVQALDEPETVVKVTTVASGHGDHRGRSHGDHTGSGQGDHKTVVKVTTQEDVEDSRQDSRQDIPPTPPGALVVPGATPQDPNDEPYTHSCPAPTWVIKRWVTWANPGVEADTYEMQRLHRSLPRLTVSWNAYPDPTLWRWMFDHWIPGRTKGVNVGVADLCAYLGRAKQEREISRGIAPEMRTPHSKGCENPKCQTHPRHFHDGKLWCTSCFRDYCAKLGKDPMELHPLFDDERFGDVSEGVKYRVKEAMAHLRNGSLAVVSRA